MFLVRESRVLLMGEEEEEMRQRHGCKLCHRRFSNGRALGGHMKAHLAALPLPLPPKNTEEQVVEMEKGYSNNNTGYGLRENPKKSFRFGDPDFSSACGCGSVILIQDRESDTDSKTTKNTTTTRPRSKRCRRTLLTKPTLPTVTSSVEEDVAISLMMLSRDVWITNKISTSTKKKNKVISSSSRAKNHRCEQCDKVFRSYQAMCGHSKICYYNNTITLTRKLGGEDDEKMFECPYCEKVFGSGQALGGHKRSHQLNDTPTSTTNCSNNSVSVKQQQHHHQLGFIDLNLPAPLDDQDDFSGVLSDA